jgi:hypothetical protein
MDDPQDEVYHHDEASQQRGRGGGGAGAASEQEQQQEQQDATITPDQVMDRIEDVMASIFERMDRNELPVIVHCQQQFDTSFE